MWVCRVRGQSECTRECLRVRVLPFKRVVVGGGIVVVGVVVGVVVVVACVFRLRRLHAVGAACLVCSVCIVFVDEMIACACFVVVLW